MTGRSLRLAVLCPHFAPDTAPTGVVMTRIVSELVEQGHEVHVVTSLPWYAKHRVEPEWAGVTWRTRTSDEPWGSVTRLDPIAGSDKRNLWRRALGFVGFSVTAAVAGSRVARGRRLDAVLVMSPPLTLGVSGWYVARRRRAPLVVNIQDVFPDAAVESGAITNRLVIATARYLERWVYRRAEAVTVLSEDLADNLRAKVSRQRAWRIRTIPNFVDVEAIQPIDRLTAYRRELGIDERPVVMYAGNIGFSQSLDSMIAAARALPDVWFVINGDGAARAELEREARDLPNVVFGEYQPAERLSEVLATGDVHAVLLKAGLGRVSVPSKTYSIMAAGRPIVAAVDPGTEVTRLVSASEGGICVPPDDETAFVEAVRTLVGDLDRSASMGRRARRHVESEASPAAVAASYAGLLSSPGVTPDQRL
ncbi:MAG: glycosyltransferase family 4 protein [Actinomycetota bacterium]|nr:glycosyltransferase family 4 protein [Actinomycetota bacterium]